MLLAYFQGQLTADTFPSASGLFDGEGKGADSAMLYAFMTITLLDPDRSLTTTSNSANPLTDEDVAPAEATVVATGGAASSLRELRLVQGMTALSKTLGEDQRTDEHGLSKFNRKFLGCRLRLSTCWLYLFLCLIFLPNFAIPFVVKFPKAKMVLGSSKRRHPSIHKNFDFTKEKGDLLRYEHIF